MEPTAGPIAFPAFQRMVETSGNAAIQMHVMQTYPRDLTTGTADDWLTRFLVAITNRWDPSGRDFRPVIGAPWDPQGITAGVSGRGRLLRQQSFPSFTSPCRTHTRLGSDLAEPICFSLIR